MKRQPSIIPTIIITLAISFCFASISNAELVGYWDFNEGTGIDVNDQSGFGNHGSIISPNTTEWTSSGIFGNALRFNTITSNGGVEVPDSDSLDLNDELSILVWIYPISCGACSIYSKNEDTSQNRSYQLFYDNRSFNFILWDDIENDSFLSLRSSFHYLSDWVHVAVTYKNGVGKMYINGQFADSKIVEPRSINKNLIPLSIGDAHVLPFGGYIDELRMYNHALTQQEIMINMNIEGIGVGEIPFADAGDDVITPENTLVELDGINSDDNDGTIEYYLWSRIPDGDVLCFETISTCDTTSLGRAAEVIELTVVDNDGNTASDTMTIFHEPPSECGDGDIEFTEVCDSNNQFCTTAGGYAGTQDCNGQCDGYNACVSSESCGDGITNGNETCDSGANNGTPNNCNLTCTGLVPPGDLEVLINFETPTTVTPSGYMKDSGLAYNSTRGYGWNSSIQSRERNLNPDKKNDTKVFQWSWATAQWNYDVPNGDYIVTFAVGDPQYSTGTVDYYLEGQLALSVQSGDLAAGQYQEVVNFPVTVTDGQLTLQLGPSVNHTSINYIEIRD